EASLTVFRLEKRRWILRCYESDYDYIRVVDNWLSRVDAALEDSPGDTVGVISLFDDANGCKKFAQRVLRFRPGASQERSDRASDEVLYVLRGSGAATLGGERLPLRPGVGVYVPPGTPWSVEADGNLELLSVLVHDPDPVPGAAHTVDLGGEERRDATAA